MEKEWIKGMPKKEGKYLTIRKFDYIGKTRFSEPKVCEFSYVRDRRTNKIAVSDEGIETCWAHNGSGEIVDYYMPLPQPPKK